MLSICGDCFGICWEKKKIKVSTAMICDDSNNGNYDKDDDDDECDQNVDNKEDVNILFIRDMKQLGLET